MEREVRGGRRAAYSSGSAAAPGHPGTGLSGAAETVVPVAARPVAVSVFVAEAHPGYFPSLGRGSRPPATYGSVSYDTGSYDDGSRRARRACAVW
ncbi:hypothetical protein SSCG_01169 [Streptomyces clavuligerus]|nr:hypothetical protein SSCG_01169 [Streptomyces clavuligerus]